MDLTLEEVAQMLNVTEATVEKWLSEGKIPSYKLQREYRFNRDEIESWMMRHREDLHPSLEGQGGIHRFNLYRAMHKGGVYSNVEADAKELLIERSMELVAPSLGLDAQVLTGLLLEREKLAPTALGNGVAVPHARDFLLETHFDAIVTLFPAEPIDYGALDGEPVHTLFFLFACDDKRHLNLLAKLAHLCSDPRTVTFLQTRPEQHALLNYVKAWEGSLG